MISCSVLSSSNKLLNVLARTDYEDFSKSCRMQNCCLRQLIAHGLQTISTGKTAVKRTLLVPDFRPAANQR